MLSEPFLEYRANVWDTQIRVKSMVGDIPWRIDHGSEKFRLISLDDLYISFGGKTVSGVQIWNLDTLLKYCSGS